MSYCEIQPKLSKKKSEKHKTSRIIIRTLLAESNTQKIFIESIIYHLFNIKYIYLERFLNSEIVAHKVFDEIPQRDDCNNEILNFDQMNLLCNAVNLFPTAGNLSSIAVNLLCQYRKLPRG